MFRGLRGELTILLLAIALVPLCVVIAITYRNAERSLTDELQKGLRAIAERQSILINNTIQDSQEQAEILASSQAVIAAMATLADAQADPGPATASLETIAEVTLEGQRIDDMMLLDLKGRVVFTARTPKLLGQVAGTSTVGEELAGLFDRTRTILETGVSDYAPNPVLGVDAAYVATPVLAESRIVGVLVLQMGARRLLEGINNHAGLGRSGETLVAVRRNSEAVVVAPLRSDRAAAFKSTVPLTDDPLNVVARAVEGGRGVGFGRDQRGVEVFAVWRYIPAIRWGIVVKVDREEAFGPVERLGQLFTWITVVTAVAVLALAFSQARRLSLPILALRRATQRVADGDFNVQIEVKSRNEIAELAETFRLMATRLNENFEDLKRTTAEREKAAREAIEAKALLEEANATLETKVENRTAELQQRNTQLQDTLDQLGRTQQQLIVREKMASLGETVAGVAHEISNPLNFVVNFSDLSREALADLSVSINNAKAHLPENDRADVEEIAAILEDNLSRIREHGRRAQEIVRSMIDITRGTAGERRAVDLNALVRDYSRAAYQGHRSRETGPEVALHFELDESLPEVSVYTSGISRVMANVVGNAIWAATEQHKRNGASPTITVSTRRHGNEVHIVVRDNGIGIAPEMIGKVFQPFFTTRPTGSGSTGLGLSMAWEIVVNQHHGRLEVTSQPGNGAEFTIALPLA